MNGAGQFSQCNRCGARIMWVKTKAGKNMPVDPQFVDFKKIKGGRERLVLPNGEVVAGERRKASEADGYGYISHFATCPGYRRQGMLHELKTYPKYFQETIEGNKLFEIRKNDRNFQVGDILNVRTWAGTEYPQIKSYPTLKKGNLVDVMNFTQTAADGGQWYYIRIAGKYYGFVSAQYIVKK